MSTENLNPFAIERRAIPCWAPFALGAIDRVVDALKISGGSISAPKLMRIAQRRTGLSDFGDIAIEEPLDRLVSSYADEANLNVFGRVAARWDMLRFLSNLLRLRAAEKQSPAILDQPIKRPIFITGLPRSATSFLHNLFAQDPANRTVRCWETIYPYPEDRRADPRRDPRPAKVERQLASFMKLAPEIRSIHPIDAYSPQECSEITGHVFRSLRFDTTHRVPSYRAWLDGAGHRAAYRFHRRFLQHMQYAKGEGQWVVKCPDHVFALDAIREIYPDARIVFMHRNPLEVLPSVAKLTEVLRRPFTRSIDRVEIGQQIKARWTRGAAILVNEAMNSSSTAKDVVHLDFRKLLKDPVGNLAILYERFGLPFSAELTMRLCAYMAERPNGGYGLNAVRPADYGLERELDRRAFRDYMDYFGFNG